MTGTAFAQVFPCSALCAHLPQEASVEPTPPLPLLIDYRVHGVEERMFSG